MLITSRNKNSTDNSKAGSDSSSDDSWINGKIICDGDASFVGGGGGDDDDVCVVGGCDDGFDVVLIDVVD